MKQGVSAVPRRLCGDSNKKVQPDTQPLNGRYGSGGASSVGRPWEAVLFIACAAVLTYYPAGMKEAWLKQPNGPWIERFWPNPELERDGGARPMAVDLGRHLLLHEPPLLKSRRQLTLSQARELWRNRVKAGWKRVEPQW